MENLSEFLDLFCEMILGNISWLWFCYFSYVKKLFLNKRKCENNILKIDKFLRYKGIKVVKDRED